ncbi:hypothetical protein MNBD_CHLOROFLEXI01-2120 [hydrothermal vent metagenome]|uniref:Ribbon-helix-helix protein CopG domain-containing protein n=1 Tax=hydrothermal vent metagenome TaxID=652676 RepID=A0A3B0VPR0_9ZZZZ
MTAVKTAISLDEILLNEVNTLAKDLHMSRSKFFTNAAKEYIRQQKKKKLVDEIGTLLRIEIQKILSGIVAVIEPDY